MTIKNCSHTERNKLGKINRNLRYRLQVLNIQISVFYDELLVLSRDLFHLEC